MRVLDDRLISINASNHSWLLRLEIGLQERVNTATMTAHVLHVHTVHVVHVEHSICLLAQLVLSCIMLVPQLSEISLINH